MTIEQFFPQRTMIGERHAPGHRLGVDAAFVQQQPMIVSSSIPGTTEPSNWFCIIASRRSSSDSWPFLMGEATVIATHLVMGPVVAE